MSGCSDCASSLKWPSGSEEQTFLRSGPPSLSPVEDECRNATGSRKLYFTMKNIAFDDDSLLVCGLLIVSGR